MRLSNRVNPVKYLLIKEDNVFICFYLTGQAPIKIKNIREFTLLNIIKGT